MQQTFSVHTTLEKFENATISVHSGFVFQENSSREIAWLSSFYTFPKPLFQIVSVHAKINAKALFSSSSGLKSVLPWGPEVFLARFPVAVIGCRSEVKYFRLPRTKKTSGAKGKSVSKNFVFVSTD